MKRILYDVPKWHTYLHREARELPRASDSDRPVAKFEDELFDRLYSGGEVDELPAKRQDARLAAWAKGFHEAASQMPAFERLAAECRGDAVASSIALEKIAAAVNPQEESETEPNASPQPQKPGAPSAVDQLRRALIPALEKASAAIDETRDAMRALEGVAVGFAPGTGSGTGSVALNAAQVRRVVAGLKNDQRLKKILELAGRFRRIAANKRRERVKHGADEIADIEMGADIARLLPSEIAKLTHPARRLAFIRDLMERQALQYQLTGTEPKGKGPLVVALDKSGSMDGERDVWATAVVLALLEQAQVEKRPFAVLCFDYHVTFEAVVKPSEQLPRDALMVGCGGGTDIARALTRALDVIEQHRGTALGKADVVLVTDGGSEPDPAPAIRERAKALKTSIVGIAIQMTRDWVQPWSDESHEIVNLSTIEDGAAAALFGASA
jgi:Mg-chelatase subunit ChlD